MKYTLSILVENQAGVLSKISGMFSRRGFNIDSLAVGTTNDPTVSRITVVTDGDEHIVEQIEKQLNKVIPVIKVKRLVEGEFISRELSLIKVHCPAAKRFEIIKIAELNHYDSATPARPRFPHPPSAPPSGCNGNPFRLRTAGFSAY